MKKIKIHFADEQTYARWLKFQHKWHGFRFKNNGKIKSKSECFSAIENKQIIESDLDKYYSSWQPVESDYHLKKMK